MSLELEVAEFKRVLCNQICIALGKFPIYTTTMEVKMTVTMTEENTEKSLDVVKVEANDEDKIEETEIVLEASSEDVGDKLITGEMIVCTKCKIPKNFDEFYGTKVCKTCTSEYQKNYRKKTKRTGDERQEPPKEEKPIERIAERNKLEKSNIEIEENLQRLDFKEELFQLRSLLTTIKKQNEVIIGALDNNALDIEEIDKKMERKYKLLEEKLKRIQEY